MPRVRPFRCAIAAICAAALAASPALASETIRCESNGGRYHYCRIDTDNRVRVEHQISRNDCRQFRDWGYDRHGIWVDNGCRAEFRVGKDGHSSDKEKIAAGVAGVAVIAALAAAANKNKESRDSEYGDAPSWAVGSFRGYDPEERANVDLTIYPGGSVRGSAGRNDFTGSVDGNRLDAGRHRFDIERSGTGFMATDRDDSRHRVYFQRTGSGY